MRKCFFITAIWVFHLSLAFAQGEGPFSVEVSTDSVLLGNFIEVKFTLENAKGTNFEAPDFSTFKIVSGPNTSSSYSVVNGEASQSVSYSYYLEPLDIGNYFILPASILVKDRTLETEPLELIVAPNPDGIKQPINPHQSNPIDYWFEDFGNITIPAPRKDSIIVKPKKKKRKTYRL